MTLGGGKTGTSMSQSSIWMQVTKAQPDIKTSALRGLCVCLWVTKHEVVDNKLINDALKMLACFSQLYLHFYLTVYFHSRVTEVAFVLILLMF